jgi:hypothetical protein
MPDVLFQKQFRSEADERSASRKMKVCRTGLFSYFRLEAALTDPKICRIRRVPDKSGRCPPSIGTIKLLWS